MPCFQIKVLFPLQVQRPEPHIGVGQTTLPGLPPLLTGQCGDLLRQMGVVVLKKNVDLISIHLQTGHAGVVAMTKAVHLTGTHAPDSPLKATDSRAMREEGHCLARISGSNLQYRALHPGLDLSKGLSPLHLKVRGGVVETDEPHGVVPLQLSPGPVLPDPHPDLPQSGGGVKFQAVVWIDGLSGCHGAEQITGVHRVNVCIRKPAPQSGNLPVTVVSDETIVPSVDPAVQISLRLGMADDKYLCHRTQLSLCFWNLAGLTRGARHLSGQIPCQAPEQRQSGPDRPAP